MDFWIWYDKLNFAVTLLAAELAVCAPLPKRRHYGARMALGCIPALLVSLLWDGKGLGMWLSATKYLVVFALSFVMMVAGCRGDVWSYLFVGIFAYCMQHIAYQTHTIVNALFGMALPGWANLLVLLALCALLYSGAWLLFKKRLSRDEGIRVDNKPQLLLSGVVLLVTVYISFFGVVYALNSGNHGSVIIICLFSDMACLLSLALEQSFVRLKKNETEMAVMRHMLSAAKYQLQESKSSIDLINVKCHDLRHQLTALSFADKEELQKLAGAIEVYDTDFKTGNEALDIVLMEKGLLCQRKKVRMTCLVNGAHLNGMKQSDIYSFFCNALENAMESVEALDEDRRAISITELCRDDFFVIRIENFFSGKMEFQDGLPVTRKDRGYHGFGVKSMRMIADKYGGELIFSTNGDIFRVDLVLPLAVQARRTT
ncbi:GHKL domain-containing protein [Pseudoflavonifractor sp. BIOML-A6]|nr:MULTISPECIES: ATP-binding protein [unclassified Pseudoflavonifractor]MTQ96623.1 GHKL domain-containing protein [Pseudoflavonifractor sp. BIOML-A16]MTR04940.1 GHKL domain-containing protein [Pseudoflavonifractor sp. BIOML-A15]MTR30812.1 GHKL domain-containing protein [Pseudoflavonifractor sp. BIOML-A14]MTR71955.1 GHKL domain-containing protein [Pseudoflavonifractor sp. BIOML-A18]MTS63479.1 GHKL domain-containing protein [Pseudoflavonifractor sp. BIOML-A5]MTS70297.1 GHKL domain-containing pr